MKKLGRNGYLHTATGELLSAQIKHSIGITAEHFGGIIGMNSPARAIAGCKRKPIICRCDLVVLCVWR
jgi:hypothetical protein